LAILFRPFGFIDSNISVMNVPDEGYSSNVPDEGYSRSALCALNYISTLLFLDTVT